MEMIRNDEGTVSEIAYRTGFSSPNYFTRCFHEYYRITPGSVKKGMPGKPDVTEEEFDNPVKPQREKKTLRQSLLQVLTGILFIAIISYLVYSIFLQNRIVEGGISDTSDKNSIAVLPFLNFSPEEENEYFCMGITDEILNQLFKISDLKVKARTSVEKYHNTSQDTQDYRKRVERITYNGGECQETG